MDVIDSLDTLAARAKGLKKRLVVAGGNAPSLIQAVARAVFEDVVEATLIGDESGIMALIRRYGIEAEDIRILHEPEDGRIASRAVELVLRGEADFLMKGLIGSADYMRAVLDRESGLVSPGGLLTHVTVMEAPAYHKLLILSDVAVLVAPDLSEKLAMLEACIGIARAIGIDQPKAGIISCVETPSFKIDSTIDGKIMKRLAGRDQIRGAMVDGPLALDLALSRRCAEEKGYDSPVAGDCDILIFPDICTGNVFFKALTLLGGARIAAVVAGARVPCVLTSRADSEDSKFVSIALGALLSERQGGASAGESKS